MKGINKAGLDLVKHFEGLRLETYLDSAGVPTIGFGTTEAAGLGIDPSVTRKITESEAEWYLVKALEKFGDQIRPLIRKDINENEWAAFLSLAYNIGPGAFKRSSALRLFNDGKKVDAANAILLWNKYTDPATGKKKVSRGLQRRRTAERDLFLRPVEQSKPKPTCGILAAFFNALMAFFGGKK